ncbi:MAG: hypothetical protein LBV67_00325 [Streptococcaceae bacterium]|jgi:ABC-2 type transport system permease protein|nr:hypothetical protein [Streptococcaceae bacterium]
MGYFLFELKVQLRSKRTLISFILLLLGCIYYTFSVAWSYDPFYSLDQATLENRIEQRQTVIDNTVIDENTHGMVGWGISINEHKNIMDRQRLESLKKNDWAAFAWDTAQILEIDDRNAFTDKMNIFFYDPSFYIDGNSFVRWDAHFEYNRLARSFLMMNRKRIEENYQLSKEKWGIDMPVPPHIKDMGEITQNVFEERTGLQTFVRASNLILPTAMFILILIGFADILTRDNEHQDMLQGFPMRFTMRLLHKFMVGLAYTFCLLLVPLSFFVIYSLNFGFGNLNLPSVTYNVLIEQGAISNTQFDFATIGEHLGKWLILFFLIVALLLLSVLFTNLLFRSQIISLVTGLFLIFGGRLYMSQGMGEFRNWRNFPTTFINIGEVISGRSWFFYGDKGLNFDTALQTFGLWSIALIIGIVFVMKGREFIVKSRRSIR